MRERRRGAIVDVRPIAGWVAIGGHGHDSRGEARPGGGAQEVVTFRIRVAIVFGAVRSPPRRSGGVESGTVSACPSS
jgi:hypothetical protein